MVRRMTYDLPHGSECDECELYRQLKEFRGHVPLFPRGTTALTILNWIAQQ
jgi:hypothetical protein